jgi:phenylacetate-CoA ligase
MKTDSKFWDPEWETKPRKILREYQETMTLKQVRKAYDQTPFYRWLYDREKLDVSRLRSLEDFSKYVPLVDKEDLRQYREETGDLYGGICTKRSNHVFKPGEMMAGIGQHSTGTTGLPTVSVYSTQDVENAGEFWARAIWQEGVRPGDLYLHYISMGWHPAHLFSRSALRQVGATIMYEDITGWEKMFELLRKYGRDDVTSMFVMALPGRPITAKLIEEGKNLHDCFPRMKTFRYSGELADSIKEYVYNITGVPNLDFWSVSETGVFGYACVEQGPNWDNNHIPEDSAFVEVLDEKFNSVSDGELGELVFTNLYFESMMYIRWKSEDLVTRDSSPCPCGSTHSRVKFYGRVSEATIIGNHRIPMRNVENVVYRHPESRLLPIQVVHTGSYQDTLKVRVCFDEKSVSDRKTYKNLIEHELVQELKVPASVQLITLSEVQALPHKFIRVVKEKG